MMALVNLNNNVLQRDKDKENERNDFPNSKSKNFTVISGKKDVKYEQKPGKQFVENQNQKNKKEKNRRKQNANNISIATTDLGQPNAQVGNGKLEDGTTKGRDRISTGTMTVTSKTYKNINSRYQYDPNQIYTLGMQMQVNHRSNRMLTPPSYRNNSNLSPSTTDNYDMSNNLRYQHMNLYSPNQWYQGVHEQDRRYATQHQSGDNWNNNNHWNTYSNQHNANSPGNNSYNNRLNRSWRSNNHLNQNYRNKNFNDNRSGGHVEGNASTNNKRNPSPSPSFSKDNQYHLRKSSSKTSLTDKSSRSSVNSSPDNHSSELEYDSDSSKVSTATSLTAKSCNNNKKNGGNNKRYGKNFRPIVYESRSAPEVSTLNDFRPSSDYAGTGYCTMSVENYQQSGSYVRGNGGFYQQQQPQGFYGSHPGLTINNFVSTLGNAGVVGVSNNTMTPLGYQMFTQDISYDLLNNNGEFFGIVDGQKKQRSTSKEGLVENGTPTQPELNNNHIFFPNPNTFPQQIGSNVTISRSKHLMNHVHRFNPATTNKNQGVQVKTTSAPITIPSETFFYNASLPFVQDEPKDLLIGSSKWDPISKDIWNKFTTSQQSETMYKKKIQLWRYLFCNIKAQFPQFGLYMVGSTIAGFGTDSSDVDMCLVCRDNQAGIDPRTNAMVTLSHIQKFLQVYPLFDEFQLIQARVPILRFKDVENSIEVDLNYNNCVGIRNTHLLHCYAQMDWRLRPMVLIVKLWAQFHNINDARNATLPSYSLVLMVIHFLQCGVQPGVLPCLHKLHPEKFSVSRDYTQIDMNEVIEPVKSENSDTLGELFVKFLEYYSKFDYSRNAISVRTASCLPIEQCRQVRAPKNDTYQWKVLCIEEPFDLTNTARSVYDYEVFERVKATFSTSWQLLSKSNRLDSVFSTPLFTPVYQQQQSPPHLSTYPIIFSPIPTPIRPNSADPSKPKQ